MTSTVCNGQTYMAQEEDLIPVAKVSPLRVRGGENLHSRKRREQTANLIGITSPREFTTICRALEALIKEGDKEKKLYSSFRGKGRDQSSESEGRSIRALPGERKKRFPVLIKRSNRCRGHCALHLVEKTKGKPKVSRAAPQRGVASPYTQRKEKKESNLLLEKETTGCEPNHLNPEERKGAFAA